MEATSSLCSNEAHLWKYVTKLEKASGSGISGNTSFKCNYCGMVFIGSYSRVKAHLFKLLVMVLECVQK